MRRLYGDQLCNAQRIAVGPLQRCQGSKRGFLQVAYSTPLGVSIITPFQLTVRKALRWVGPLLAPLHLPCLACGICRCCHDAGRSSSKVCTAAL